MSNGKTARALVGRTIVSVRLRACRDGRGGYTASPIITLDDGSSLSFSVHETESGDYGIDLLRTQRTE